MSQAARAVLDILIIEPDAGVGEHLERALKSHGLNALALDSAEHIADVVHNETPQLILTEYQLGDLSGIELTKQVLEDSSKIPEVVVMYQSRAPSLSDAHEAGACHLLQKPINIDELIAVYKRYCRQENKRRFERVRISHSDAAIHAQIAHEENPQKIKISDIGRGGFYFEVPAGALSGQIGDVLNFELTLTMVPSCAFEAQGVIRWVKEGFDKSGAGVEFLSLPGDIEKLLQAYVELFKVKAFVPKQ